MFIPAGGSLLNVVDIGQSDRTLVAVGGWVGGWELWQQPIEQLHRSWRCVAFDHRGAGASTAPAEAITASGLVDDLLEVLDRLAIDRCVLAGESLGTLTVLAAYARQPHRFDGLVLVDGMAAPAGDADADAVRRGYDAYVAGFVDACIPEDGLDHLRRWGRQILARSDPEAAARMLEVHQGVDLRPMLSDVRVPTLVIHGERDAIVPVSSGIGLAEAIPGATLVVVPGAGHVPTVTAPAAVVAAIDDWAARLPPVTDAR